MIKEKQKENKKRCCENIQVRSTTLLTILIEFYRILLSFTRLLLSAWDNTKLSIILFLMRVVILNNLILLLKSCNWILSYLMKSMTIADIYNNIKMLVYFNFWNYQSSQLNAGYKLCLLTKNPSYHFKFERKH